MVAIIHLLATFIADVFKSRRRLEVENLFLRHQLNIALRRAPQRPRLRAGDRALMVWIPNAAMALGATYDPTVLAKLGVAGLGADVEKARTWYQKAESLGSTEATRRLAILANR